MCDVDLMPLSCVAPVVAEGTIRVDVVQEDRRIGVPFRQRMAKMRNLAAAVNEHVAGREQDLAVAAMCAKPQTPWRGRQIPDAIVDGQRRGKLARGSIG